MYLREDFYLDKESTYKGIENVFVGTKPFSNTDGNNRIPGTANQPSYFPRWLLKYTRPGLRLQVGMKIDLECLFHVHLRQDLIRREELIDVVHLINRYASGRELTYSLLLSLTQFHCLSSIMCIDRCPLLPLL